MKDTEPKFIGVNRDGPQPRLSESTLEQWHADVEKARAKVREWLDVNVWGKKP